MRKKSSWEWTRAAVNPYFFTLFVDRHLVRNLFLQFLGSQSGRRGATHKSRLLQINAVGSLTKWNSWSYFLPCCSLFLNINHNYGQLHKKRKYYNNAPLKFTESWFSVYIWHCSQGCTFLCCNEMPIFAKNLQEGFHLSFPTLFLLVDGIHASLLPGREGGEILWSSMSELNKHNN